MKILMVDDSAADRKYYRRLLAQAGESSHEIHEASGAQAGLASYRDLAPDCVLLDYRLPDMDGIEFLARLSAGRRDCDPACAVVMLTGAAGDDMAVQALRAGAHDYLTKDAISAEGLRLAVEKATQKAGLIRALRAERDLLARSLAEKDVLIKEVHHRVKNNLQVIASLLRLQAGCAGDRAAASALRDSQHRVEAMAMIHEQLYASGNLRAVDLAQHVHLLLASLLTAYGETGGRISLTVNVTGGRPLELGVHQAIPAGLILHELISNALKHAFPNNRRGALTIHCRSQEGTIRLSVSDDGVGLPEELDPAQAKSLGLRIAGILAGQLKGVLAFERSPAGATFTLSFPEE